MKSVLAIIAVTCCAPLAHANSVKICQATDPSTTGYQIRLTTSRSNHSRVEILRNGKATGLSAFCLPTGNEVLLSEFKCNIDAGNFVKLLFSEREGYSAEYFSDGIAGPRSMTGQLPCD